MHSALRTGVGLSRYDDNLLLDLWSALSFIRYRLNPSSVRNALFTTESFVLYDMQSKSRRLDVFRLISLSLLKMIINLKHIDDVIVSQIY